MQFISKILMMSVIVVLLGSLSSCGTVSGFGHDVSATGHNISRAAS